jgi:TPR repeat protein
MRTVRVIFVCAALPVSWTAGRAQNVDELQLLMAKAPKACSSDYRPYGYLDYRACDEIADEAAATKCADEVARKNGVVWRWNRFVRNCRDSPASGATAVAPVVAAPTLAEGKTDPGSEEAAALLQRARKLAEAGDIAAARLVLRRAAEAHNAQAALALGGLYDPIVLKELGAYGVTPDIAEARSWYEKASSYGSAEAPQRLKMLVEHGR